MTEQEQKVWNTEFERWLDYFGSVRMGGSRDYYCQAKADEAVRNLRIKNEQIGTQVYQPTPRHLEKD